MVIGKYRSAHFNLPVECRQDDVRSAPSDGSQIFEVLRPVFYARRHLFFFFFFIITQLPAQNFFSLCPEVEGRLFKPIASDGCRSRAWARRIFSISHRRRGWPKVVLQQRCLANAQSGDDGVPPTKLPGPFAWAPQESRVTPNAAQVVLC